MWRLSLRVWIRLGTAFCSTRTGCIPRTTLLPRSIKRPATRRRGFRPTCCWSSAFGFDQGFDSYNENHLVGHSQSTGAELNGAVAKWLDDERDPELPYFLYIHHFEPHFDYLRSGEEWGANYDGPLTGSESMEQLIGATDKLRNEEFRFLASRYDAEIKYQDQLLRELWGEFGSRSLQDEVVLVITADHGEEFGDHGDLAHQYKMYDELLRVPLVIRSGIDTGLVFAPGEEQRPQGLRDLGATLLRLYWCRTQLSRTAIRPRGFFEEGSLGIRALASSYDLF